MSRRIKGVGLAAMVEGVAAGRVVHVAGEGWAISSHNDIVDILTCDVLERCLPGRLGCYLLPADAVLHWTSSASRLTLYDFKRLAEAERAALDSMEGMYRPVPMNHLSVTTVPSQVEEEEEEEDEEDYSGDEEEADCTEYDEHGGEEGDEWPISDDELKDQI